MPPPKPEWYKKKEAEKHAARAHAAEEIHELTDDEIEEVVESALKEHAPSSMKSRAPAKPYERQRMASAMQELHGVTDKEIDTAVSRLRAMPPPKPEQPFPLVTRKGEEFTALIHDRHGRVKGLKNEEYITTTEALEAVASAMNAISDTLDPTTDRYIETDQELHEKRLELKEREHEFQLIKDPKARIEAKADLELLREDVRSLEAESESLLRELETISKASEPWVALRNSVREALKESDEEEGAVVLENPFYKEGGKEIEVIPEVEFDRMATYDRDSLLDWQATLHGKRRKLKETINELEAQEQALVARASEMSRYDEPLRQEVQAKEDAARSGDEEAIRDLEAQRIVSEFGAKGIKEDLKSSGIREALEYLNDEMHEVIEQYKKVNDDLAVVNRQLSETPETGFEEAA